jgi:alpha-L-arabinofuranosidase
MIFFDNNNACLTPNYHVQKMFSVNQGDIYFDKIVNLDLNDTTAAASCVQDNETGDIILKLVNTGNEPRVMKVNLKGFKRIVSKAQLTLLTGDPEAENTLEKPEVIVPTIANFQASRSFSYNAPAISVTVIRIRTK